MITELYVSRKINFKKALAVEDATICSEDANLLQNTIETGIETHNPRKIIVLTHVPPFPGGLSLSGKANG